MAEATILVALVGAAFALTWHFSRDRVIDRRVARGPRLPVAGLTDGMTASLRGTARAAGRPLTAPLSGALCVYYELEVQAFEASAAMWVTVHLEARARGFLIADDSGAALVEPGTWRISVERDAPFEPVSAGRLRALLGRRAGLQWTWPSRLRVRERALREGRPIAARGRTAREPDPDPAAAPGGYRQTAVRPVLRGARQAPLYITDHVDT